MANVKISALPSAAALVGNEPVPAVQGGTTVQTTTQGIANLAVVPAAANPTGTAGPAAVNGVATTFMRSDAAPAVQKASAAQFGIVEVDGTTITAAAGVISAVTPAGANPTATAGPAAVNGSATTFMRSDGAPAIQKASAAQFGIVEVDGTTITAAAGVISAVTPSGANPSASVGLTAVNGSAATFTRSDGAPALSQAIAPTWTGKHIFSANPVTLSGTISGSGIFGTTAIGLNEPARTYTDATSSGTISVVYVNELGTPTFTATSATTFSKVYTLHVGAPTASTNVTAANGNRFAALFDDAIVVNGTSGSGSVFTGNDNGPVLNITQNASSGGAGGLNAQIAGTSSQQVLNATSNNGGTTVFSAQGTGTVLTGSGAISTSATDGFLYIPTCAGTPTGVPTTQNNRVALVFDTTNSQFWIFTGGAWKQPKTPAGAATVTWQ